jgi:rhodanese-related sulfurtransferase
VNLFSQLFGAGISQLDAIQAQQRLNKSPKPFLLDVRQPEEYKNGHIPGAKLIPLDQLNERIKEIPGNREIICVCRSGNRSRTATGQLVTAGYKASNLKGGMIGWSRHGLPVKRGISR